MPTLADLQAQYDRLQEAIAQTEPEHCGGLHYASGLLVAEIKNHPDYSLAYPLQGDCQAALRLVLRGPQEAPQDAEPCTFCGQPSDPSLATADWPMCPACFEGVAAPWPEETEALWP